MLELPDLPAESLLARLLAAFAGVSGPGVLILDDYHAIENPAVHQTLAFLLYHLPPGLRLYLSSRREPDGLPLSRLRAEGELFQIQAGQLRFGREDIRRFLDQAGLDLPEKDLDLLARKTEGWSLGLHLVRLALQETPDPARFLAEFSGQHRHVTDYLVDEALQGLPERLQRFLLGTSVVASFNASLAQALTRESDCQAILEDLERRHLFLIPLDDHRQCYRYHNLMAEMLQERLSRLDQFLLAGLHRRASRWYAAHDLLPEAIRHALAAGDIPEAAHLIETAIQERVSLGETAPRSLQPGSN